MEYYVPRTKGELVTWFVVKMGYNKASLAKFAKNQLYAIYHKIMRGRLGYNNFTTTS